MHSVALNATSAIIHWASFLAAGAVFLFTDKLDFRARISNSFSDIFADPPVYGTSQWTTINLGWLVVSIFFVAAVYRTVACVFYRLYYKCVIEHAVHLVSIAEFAYSASIGALILMMTAGAKEFILLFFIPIVAFAASASIVDGELVAASVFRIKKRKFNWADTPAMFGPILSLLITVGLMVALFFSYLWQTLNATHHLNAAFPYWFFFAMLVLFISSILIASVYFLQNVAMSARDPDHSNVKFAIFYVAAALVSVEVPTWLIVGGLIHRNL